MVGKGVFSQHEPVKPVGEYCPYDQPVGIFTHPGLALPKADGNYQTAKHLPEGSQNEQGRQVGW